MSFFSHKKNIWLNFSSHKSAWIATKQILRQSVYIMTKVIWQQNSKFSICGHIFSSNTCQMWRISDLSTSVIWKNLNFFPLWRNFSFPHNCHTWKAENSPHGNFFSTNNISDKYEVWSPRGVVKKNGYFTARLTENVKFDFLVLKTHFLSFTLLGVVHKLPT